MATQPCEVSLCDYDDEGNRSRDRDCGQPARIDVNGFPMCAAHFASYEEEGLVESVEPLTVKPPPAEPKGPGA